MHVRSYPREHLAILHILEWYRECPEWFRAYMASTERLRKVPKHSEGSKNNLKSPEVPWPPTHVALRSLPPPMVLPSEKSRRERGLSGGRWHFLHRIWCPTLLIEPRWPGSCLGPPTLFWDHDDTDNFLGPRVWPRFRPRPPSGDALKVGSSHVPRVPCGLASLTKQASQRKKGERDNED
jgi:hypothetical protein